MAALAEICINERFYSHELSGPYNFKSGKNEGRSLESLMFSNRSYLTKLKHIRDSKLGSGSYPDKLHLCLAWILNAGEFVQASESCPYCSNEQRNIKLFSVRWSGGACSFGRPYVCCEDADCKYRIIEEKSSLLPLKFSSLNHFRNTKQREAGAFFKDIFLGTGRLDPEKAFELFLSATTNAIQL